MMTLSRRAKERIGAYLEQFGELLPLACPDGEFWTLNVTKIIDALDEARSDVLRSAETGRILVVWKHVFRAEALGGAEVFRLPEAHSNLIYVTDAFAERLASSGLEGLTLVQLWAPN